MAMNREQKRQLRRQGELAPDGTPAPRRSEPRPAPRAQSDRATPTQFVREVRGELRKVAWPSREEIVRFSIIVFVTVVVLTAFVALVDYLSTEGILYLFD
ncbi:MAG TPA: preprotein translocase subunit SecE [Acidimicrobiales bacterium]|jgi:preprotein translocase subunit SecE|nr:preprotein translocase subunit SecE [Acidimicrobiales bacterium]